jgi:hypothetical protein
MQQNPMNGSGSQHVPMNGTGITSGTQHGQMNGSGNGMTATQPPAAVTTK